MSLKNLNINIDLFYKNNFKKAKIDKRTTAISESNFHFLSKQLKIKQQYFWPCKNIDLYYEKNLDLLNFFSFDKPKKNLLYMFQNNKIKKFLFKKLTESKNVITFRYLREYIEAGYSFSKKQYSSEIKNSFNILDRLLEKKKFTKMFKLKKGEILILNNKYMAHGRTKFYLNNIS